MSDIDDTIEKLDKALAICDDLGKIHQKLADEHRDLMRAAFNLCRLVERDTTEFNELWDLCKDYDPTPE